MSLRYRMQWRYYGGGATGEARAPNRLAKKGEKRKEGKRKEKRKEKEREKKGENMEKENVISGIAR